MCRPRPEYRMMHQYRRYLLLLQNKSVPPFPISRPRISPSRGPFRLLLECQSCISRARWWPGLLWWCLSSSHTHARRENVAPLLITASFPAILQRDHVIPAVNSHVVMCVFGMTNGEPFLCNRRWRWSKRRGGSCMDCCGIRRNETRARSYEALYVWSSRCKLGDRQMEAGKKRQVKREEKGKEKKKDKGNAPVGNTEG